MNDFKIPSVIEEVVRILKEVEELDSFSDSGDEIREDDQGGNMRESDRYDYYTPPNHGGIEDKIILNIITNRNSQFHQFIHLLNESDFSDDINSLQLNIDRLKGRGITEIEVPSNIDENSDVIESLIQQNLADTSLKIWYKSSKPIYCDDVKDFRLFDKALETFQKYIQDQEEEFLPLPPVRGEKDVFKGDLDKMNEVYERAKEELYLAIGENPDFKMSQQNYAAEWNEDEIFEKNLEHLELGKYDDFSWVKSYYESFPNFEFKGHYNNKGEEAEEEEEVEEPPEEKQSPAEVEKSQENLDHLSEDFFGLEIEDEDEEGKSDQDTPKEADWSETPSQSVEEWLGPDIQKIGEWTKYCETTEEPIKPASVAGHVLLYEEIKDPEDPHDEVIEDDRTMILGNELREEGLIPDWKGSLLSAFRKHEVEKEISAARPHLNDLAAKVISRPVEEPCVYPYGSVSYVLLNYEFKKLEEKSKNSVENETKEKQAPVELKDSEKEEETKRFTIKVDKPAFDKKPTKKKRGWKKFDEELSD